MSAAVRSSFFALWIRPARMLRIVARIALDERHDGDARLESRQTQRQLREKYQRDGDHLQRVAVFLVQAVTPRRNNLRVGEHVKQRVADDDDVQPEIDEDDHDRETDRLLETLEKDRAQEREQNQRECDRMVEGFRHERIADDVGGRVGSGEGDRDDEIGGSEAEEAQDERLPLPSRQQLFEHRDAALTVRRCLRYTGVDWQRTEQRQPDQHKRGQR